MDLSLADLAGALLHGASISNSVLTFAHLMGADLTDANLGHSDLRGAEVSASQIALVASMRGIVLRDGYIKGLTLDDLY
jgi:uncharacterized protein YjbI with pentapeptide repeats